MPSTKTISKGIRLKKEVAEYFEGKPLNKYVESMYEHVVQGEIKLEEDCICVHTKQEEQPIDVHTENNHALRELKGMCNFFGVDTNEFLMEVLRNVQSGAITYEEGKLKTYGEVDISRLTDACHERNVPIEKAIEKCAQMILRS